MTKINLHAVDQHDAQFFNMCYDTVNIVIHDRVVDTFICNSTNYPLLTLGEVICNVNNIKNYLNNDSNNKIILYNILEGNNTITDYLVKINLIDYFNANQIIIFSSGNFESGIFLNLDAFLNSTGNIYNQVVSANTFNEIYNKQIKPYKFLFLNKISRPHRKQLIQLLNDTGILAQALWSDHSSNRVLPADYRDYYNKKVLDLSINYTDYDFSWPDGTIFPDLYIDTYFSVVTETNFEIPKDYRTEKIYKPLLVGHPFIAVSGYHFYQELHNIGFKTFGNLIDESFDNILNNHDRLNKIANTINSLCQSNLIEFLHEAKPICDYNREHYLELLGKNSLRTYNLLTNFFNKLNAKTA